MHENKIYFLFIHTQQCQQNFRCCFQIRLEKASSYDLLLLCDFCIMEFAFLRFSSSEWSQKVLDEELGEWNDFFSPNFHHLSAKIQNGDANIQMSVAGVSSGYVFGRMSRTLKAKWMLVRFFIPLSSGDDQPLLAVT